MSSLTDQLTVVINMLFVFATVGFISSAVADGVAGLFRRREALLERAMAELLNDRNFDGLALRIYNNPHVNPRVAGVAQGKAELGFVPAWIDPAAFAMALAEVLHIIPSAPAAGETIQLLPVDETLPDATRTENAIINATRRIEAYVTDESAARNLIQWVTNLIRRCDGRRQPMEQSIALWFDAGMRTVTEQYRKEIKLWTFAIGFCIAALLDLQPIPVGGLLALTRGTAAEPRSAQVAQAVPLLANLVEWAVVAASTLFGAQMWYGLLKALMSRGGGPSEATGPSPAGAAPPAPPPGPPPAPRPEPPPSPAPVRRKRSAAARTARPGPQSSD